MMEGAEVMEVHMNRGYTQLVIWWNRRLQENGNLTVIDRIDRKVEICMETGKTYDRGIFIIKAVDLYWRGE